MLWVESRALRCVLDTTLCTKDCQWLAADRWFSLGTAAFSTNKTDRHDISKILLKVVLSTINLTHSICCADLITCYEQPSKNNRHTFNHMFLFICKFRKSGFGKILMKTVVSYTPFHDIRIIAKHYGMCPYTKIPQHGLFRRSDIILANRISRFCPSNTKCYSNFSYIHNTDYKVNF